MRKMVVLVSLLACVLFLGSAAGTSQSWSIPNLWYGYPSQQIITFDDKLMVFTQESNNVQVWQYDGTEWTVDNANLGKSVLSNPIIYKSNLYVSVDLGNISFLAQYDGVQWTYMNDTDNLHATQLLVHKTVLIALTNSSQSQVKEYTGFDWRGADWDDNLTGTIETICSYDNRLYVLMHGNELMYEVSNSGISPVEIPDFGIFPRPIIEYSNLMWSAYRNQIFTFDGTDWELQKVISPTEYISTMQISEDSLYIGTQNILNRNESSVFIYTDDFIETPISGNIVTGIEIYGGEVYASTNLGLFIYTDVESGVQQQQWMYSVWSLLILGIILVLFVAFTYTGGMEDVLMLSGGFALWVVAAIIYSMPLMLLSFVTFIAGLAIFLVLIFILNKLMDCDFEFRYDDKDVRVVIVVLTILLIIEIAFQLFSKAIGIM